MILPKYGKAFIKFLLKLLEFPDICDTTNSPFISERWVEWHIEGEIHSLQSLVLDDGSQE